MSTTIAHIHRYPIKGFAPERLERTTLEVDRGLPGDRRYAIAHGASKFDASAPRWADKRQFLNLMSNERLAALDVRWTGDGDRIDILRDGKRVAGGDLATPVGRELVNQFVAAFLGREEARGTPKIVETPGLSLSDIEPDWISIIGLASVADLERVARAPIDPVRFRSNLHVTGTRPWEEFDWVGRSVRIGGAELHVEERIGRCAAINVAPGSGARDMNLVKTLAQGFDHTCCGVYARVITAGSVETGDAITPLD